MKFAFYQMGSTKDRTMQVLNLIFFATSGQVFGYESCLSDSSYSAARKLGNHNTMFADTHVSLTIKERSQACWQLCVINATRTKTAHVIW